MISDNPLRQRTVVIAGSVATLAALLASTGDFLLLAHGAARAAGDRTVDAPALIAGHYLGVTFIPFFAIGYWLAAKGLGAVRGWTRLVFPLGAAISAYGAVVHGVTAVLIETNLAGEGAASPATVPHATYLMPLWGLVFAPALIVSGLFAIIVLAGRTGFPRWFAAANPAVLMMLVAAASLPFPSAAAYVIPAAPNLAHVLFFAFMTVILARRRGTGS
jgi:hypothetical protein